MDYEKAYKEAKARMSIAFNNNRCTIGFMNEIFPELQESEDEKVKNELIDAIRGLWENDALPMPLSVERKDKWIAWLEKQAERKTPQWMIDFLDNYRRMIGCSLDYDEARDVDGKILCIKEWLEKQGVKAQGKTALEAIKEEKVDNANKLELKFHEGEWIVDNQGLVHQIERVVENVTTHTFGYDIVGGGYFNDKSEGVHLWTIKDAKDGDVLVASDDSIFLFAGVVDCACKYYAALTTDNYIKINKETKGGYWETSKAVYPATKEQRELLFQKMHEAGYEWNAGKKKLKKLDKFKEGDWIINNDVYDDVPVKIKEILNYLYLCERQDGVIIELNKDAVLKEFKHWDITDAVDGNVLADKNTILIFKGIGNTEWNDVIDYHCYYDCYRKDFIVQEDVDYWGDIKNNQLKPATKEQCDLLFQKMHEAEYEWDWRNKELKKFHVIDEDKTEMDYCFTKMMNDEKVSSAWSKEDEKIYQSIMDDTVQENQLNDKQTNWLRDIKYRYFPQPKQEWSEEDEHTLKGIIDEIEANKASAPSYDIDTYDRFLSWLKSLKQRIGG